MPDIAKQFSTVTDKVEQLRQYLDTKTQPVPPYVLLVGKRALEMNGTSSHESFIGTIPMAVLSLNGIEAATDLLYRFPRLHFDFSNGTYLMPPTMQGSINFVVGSIPVDDVSFIDDYFERLIPLEKMYSEKNFLNGIIANGILGYGSGTLPPMPSDTAGLGEETKSIMSDSGAVVTLYEKGGSRPSAYIPTLPLTETNFTSVWNSQFHDWVLLTGHNATYSLYWPIPDPGLEEAQETAIWRYFADLTKLTSKAFFGLFDGCSSAHPGDIEALTGFFKKKLVYTGIGYTDVIPETTFALKIFQRIKQGYSIGDALQYQDKQVQEIMEEEVLGDPSACLIPRNFGVALSNPSNSVRVSPGVSLTLSWKKADATWAYNVQISNSSDFTNLVKSDITYTNSYQISVLPIGNYFWRIAGVSDAGLEQWSETRAFIVNDPLALSVVPLPSTTTNPDITISGVTNGDSIVVNNHFVAIVNTRFSCILSLVGGSNIITITAIKGTQKSVQTYKVFYIKPVTLRFIIGKPTVWIDGDMKALEAPPMIYNSRTLVPIRVLVESIGGSIDWNASAQMVNISLGDTRLTLIVGSNVALLNNTLVSIDAADTKVVPKIVNGRTLLPLRFVAECLGFQVDWKPTAQTIVLTYSYSGS